MRYRVEVDREPRAAFAEWVDALRFAKAAAAADEESTVQVIETGDEEELILSMRRGYSAIVGSYPLTLPEERGRGKRGERLSRVESDGQTSTAPIYYVKEDDILYRVRDRSTGPLPDEVLWHSGWRPILGCFTVSPNEIPGGGRPGGPNNQADPLVMTKISEITKAEAQEIARRRGLPTEGWDPEPPTATEGPRRRAKKRDRVELNDEEHELILDNPEADAFCAEQSIQWALSKGWSREEAERMFRPKKG